MLQRKAVKEGKVAPDAPNPAADNQPRQLTTAAGNPGNSRARYTLIARQLTEGYFDDSREPIG